MWPFYVPIKWKAVVVNRNAWLQHGQNKSHQNNSMAKESVLITYNRTTAPKTSKMKTQFTIVTLYDHECLIAIKWVSHASDRSIRGPCSIFGNTKLPFAQVFFFFSSFFIIRLLGLKFFSRGFLVIFFWFQVNFFDFKYFFPTSSNLSRVHSNTNSIERKQFGVKKGRIDMRIGILRRNRSLRKW